MSEVDYQTARARPVPLHPSIIENHRKLIAQINANARYWDAVIQPALDEAKAKS